jgi:transposase
MSIAVGIDVHKATLMVAIAGGRTWEVANTPRARATLVTHLRTLAPQTIVLEPSGGYERPLLAALQAADLPAARINARQIRAFARARRLTAKTDRLDARVLATYGATFRPDRTPALEAGTAALAALSARRRQLTDTMAAEQRRRETAMTVAVPSIDRHLEFLAGELAELTAQQDALIAADPALARKHTILTSVPGIGPTTAALLLAELPELGHRDRGAIAALAGVAPYDDESGATRQGGHIDGGRERVRTGLFMPTRSAMRHNPVIASFAARLRASGKPDRVGVIACMRKLLTILNAMLAKDEVWTPQQPTP